jgi:hypothetical protein
MAQQKRFAFKEQVTFHADEARTQPVFGFRARDLPSPFVSTLTSPIRAGSSA